VVYRKLTCGANQNIYVRDSHILSSLNLPRIERIRSRADTDYDFFSTTMGAMYGPRYRALKKASCWRCSLMVSLSGSCESPITPIRA
jgi:hypothetical protein